MTHFLTVLFAALAGGYFMFVYRAGGLDKIGQQPPTDLTADTLACMRQRPNESENK